MFKIQNLINRSRQFFNKTNVPGSILRNTPKLSTRLQYFSNFFVVLPTTCLFGINLLKWNRANIDTIDSVIPIVLQTSGAEAKKENVSELIALITTKMREGNLEEAKSCIDEAICISEQNNFVEFLPQLYHFLVLATIREGKNLLAEEILVRSIEKLTELGYKETSNEIVRLQLILARLYQLRGDSAMAGLGFVNCITIQESKFNADGVTDDVTTGLYLSLLFWYGLFLNDKGELFDSKRYMEKALTLSRSMPNNSERTIFILHNLAELSFRLTEFDEAIKYLVEGIRLCLLHLSLDAALPVFMVKLGLMYLIKGMDEKAEYWCSIAYAFAKSSYNACAEDEASLCLNYLKNRKSKNKRV
ncbi:tetratricopeptide repeat protein 19 homolog, mitochondrial-like [Bradysia coprophila]|uniref:tetratricopeptide repeat protein 19 homolog, mitochondrial-like n=1 Tax=Bradysia coprophila TaxID=38358 RepID=UPI00187D8D03|nr:tetratricopeptide repeat protein 19 homolog, mitochondrial-like [Bradysia coprophila]